MNNRTQSSNFFLLELVLNLFLFVLCAAICVGLLLSAWKLSRDSSALTAAVNLAQTAAEEWKATGTVSAESEGLLCELRETGNSADILILQDGNLVYSLEGVARP